MKQKLQNNREKRNLDKNDKRGKKRKKEKNLKMLFLPKILQKPTLMRSLKMSTKSLQQKIKTQEKSMIMISHIRIPQSIKAKMKSVKTRKNSKKRKMSFTHPSLIKPAQTQIPQKVGHLSRKT